MPNVTRVINLPSSSFPAGTPAPTKVNVNIMAADGTTQVTWKDVPIDPANPGSVTTSFDLPVADYVQRATTFAGTTQVGGTAVVPFSVLADVTLSVAAP